MKFKVSSKTLYNYASSVSKIINAKNPLQILNNFLFTLEGEYLTIKGADMDNFLEAKFMVNEAEGSGSFCVDARRLVELFKVIPDQGVTFNIDDSDEIKIDYNIGEYKTMAIDGAEFPNISKETSDPANICTFTIPAETVIAGMDNTIFAVGADEIRPQMMGIYWDVKADLVNFVATDTRKLVLYQNTSVKPDTECNFILPAKGASILKNVFSGADDIEVTVSPVNVVFKTEDFTFDCRLINGRYPDYNRVIPKDNPYMMTVDRLTLLNAVRRVSIGGDDGSNLIKMRFSAGELTLQASDTAYNTSSYERVECNYNGNDLLIGFDGQFIIDILQIFGNSDVNVYLGDPSRPALFKSSEDEVGAQLNVILMPMNIIA